jgi:hypothetical protein
MTHSETVRRFWTALLPMAAVLAFAVQPVLRFADIDLFAGSVMGAAAGVFGLWNTQPYRTWHDRAIAVGGMLMLIWGMTGVVSTCLAVGPAIRANDHRCLVIQNDMLSARPRRPDGPDLFQALGCRPQGEGGVYAIPLKTVPAATPKV